MSRPFHVVPANDLAAGAASEFSELHGPIDAGGGPPHDGRMEERLRKVEESIIKLETSLSHLSTKADVQMLRGDMQKHANDLAWRLISVVALMLGAMFAALQWWPPKPLAVPTTTSSAPIVITIPAATASPPASGQTPAAPAAPSTK